MLVAGRLAPRLDAIRERWHKQADYNPAQSEINPKRVIFSFKPAPEAVRFNTSTLEI
jgi:hypothetical protein